MPVQEFVPMAFSRGCLLVCFAWCVLAARAGAAQESKPKPAVDPRVLIWLIEQLGSDDFAQREVAVRILHSLGEPALAALRRAALNDGNPEVRCRAAQVVRDIETRFRAVTALA